MLREALKTLTPSIPAQRFHALYVLIRGFPILPLRGEEDECSLLLILTMIYEPLGILSPEQLQLCGGSACCLNYTDICKVNYGLLSHRPEPSILFISPEGFFFITTKTT